MSRYRDKDGVCFAAESRIRLLSGIEIDICTLRAGMEVWTPKGGRKVVAIIATPVRGRDMCRIGDLVVTPWHPIFLNQEWAFPSTVSKSIIPYTGSIYSLVLEQDQDDGAHAVEVGGILAVTLGHGIVQPEIQVGGRNDVRMHEFFGDYKKVLEGVKHLSVEDGVAQSGGAYRDRETGLVCGFLKLDL